MKKMAFFLLVFTQIVAFGKIYDCFPFFNEIELLKIRLAELDEVVDYFVLVESVETQRGGLKPLYFEENKSLFTKHLPKIIHVKIETTHPQFGLWERENYQRNQILQGLVHCNPMDIILISDVDEIPRKAKIKELLIQGKNHFHGPISFEMSMHYFHLNRQTSTQDAWGGGKWVGTIATVYRNVMKHSPQYFRKHSGIWSSIQNGGWHFTWMGGRDRVRKKLESVVEGRDSTLDQSDESIDQWINSHPVFPLDQTYPEYVIQNQEYLKSIGFVAEYR